jgi:hypothetical protein
MAECGPLTISGWGTIALTVMVVLITVGYGELCARDAAQKIRDEFAADDIDFDADDIGQLSDDQDEADTTPLPVDRALSTGGRHSRELNQ